MVEILEKESAKTVKDVSGVAEYTPASPVVEQKDSVVDDPASLYDDADALSTKIESAEKTKIMDQKVKWLNSDVYNCKQEIESKYKDAPFYLDDGAIKAHIDWKIDYDYMDNDKYTWTEENVTYMNKLYKETRKELNFSEKNYKIDEGKSKERKLANGWKEVEKTANIDNAFSDVKIKVLYKKLGTGTVWEYQNDGIMPKNLVGVQLFDWRAILNLKLENKLPNQEQITHLFFEQGTNFKGFADISPGMYNSQKNAFDNVNTDTHTICRLSNGSTQELRTGQRRAHETDLKNCLPLRLLK